MPFSRAISCPFFEVEGHSITALYGIISALANGNQVAIIRLFSNLPPSAVNTAINPGFNMIAFNFQPMDNDKDGISIQDFFQNKADLVAGNGPTTSDQIQVWDGSKFTIYFYRANSDRPKFTLGPCWVKNGATTSGTPTTDTIPAGKGFWYAHPTGKDAGTLIERSPIAPAAAE